MRENTVERRAIPGYDGRYEIDTAGNVYAMFPHHGIPSGRTIKSRVNPDGYITVTLAHEGRGKVRTIHRLLMLTFRPVDDSRNLEVNHIDGDKANNRLDNLEWLTHRDNIIHAHKVLDAWAGTQERGEQINSAKLTAADVRRIRELHAIGLTRRQLAEQYGVTPTNIGFIVRRMSWAHVE